MSGAVAKKISLEIRPSQVDESRASAERRLLAGLATPYDRYYCNDGVGSLFHSQNLPESQQVAADKGPPTR